MPALSVIMPVHNAAPFLDASIASILGQTFADFEFVILDDASTDGSLEIARAWGQQDARIRIIESAEPLGVVASANRVLREARGTICARMDADDISAPDRLACEWVMLEGHPEASLVGTLWRGIDPAGQDIRPVDRWRLLRRSAFAPFPHGSIMFRRDWALRIGGYRQAFVDWEDFDFFIRMSHLGPIYVVAKPLYSYRFHGATATAARTLPSVERMYRLVDHLKDGGDYATLLDEAPQAEPRPTDPRAIRSWAAPHVWAGRRPGIPLSRRFRSAWSPLPAALYARAVGLWSESHPTSLRAVLGACIRARDLVSSLWIPPGEVVRWNPREDRAAGLAPALVAHSTK